MRRLFALPFRDCDNAVACYAGQMIDRDARAANFSRIVGSRGNRKSRPFLTGYFLIPS